MERGIRTAPVWARSGNLCQSSRRGSSSTAVDVVTEGWASAEELGLASLYRRNRPTHFRPAPSQRGSPCRQSAQCRKRHRNIRVLQVSFDTPANLKEEAPKTLHVGRPSLDTNTQLNLEKDETPLLSEWGLRLNHKEIGRASKQPCSCTSPFPRHGTPDIHVNRSHFGSSLMLVMQTSNHKQTCLKQKGC